MTKTTSDLSCHTCNDRSRQIQRSRGGGGETRNEKKKEPEDGAESKTDRRKFLEAPHVLLRQSQKQEWGLFFL